MPSDQEPYEPHDEPLEDLQPQPAQPAQPIESDPQPIENNDNPNPNPPNPPPPPPTDTPAHDPDFRTLKLVLLSLFTMIFVPVNAWLAHSMSPKALLDGYIFGFCFAMYSLAAVILVLGILVPPVMLLHWVWEVCVEVVPVE
ncbi:MAG: hypothetical protein M1831_003939 [Alyxoria varia]|nr:MAG: hypothetical protein M1831_003939 [Alyxoria varia]